MDRNEYNEEQLTAIECPKPVVIVPAGPGSGKSHTLIGRVWWLVDHENANPAGIIILTFTNNAARVLTERLMAKGIRVGYVGTLHGYCMRILQAHGALLGYRSRSITVLSESAKDLLLSQVHQEVGKKISKTELMKRQSPTAQLVWDEYEFRLKRANMVDYDKILTEALELLQRDSVKVTSFIYHLLVDERQDSGAIDTEIFAALPVKTRFFVGDVDQCIFSFRGAAPELFVKEAREHGFIALEKNHRSDSEICRVANSLISHNKNRIQKSLIPAGDLEGMVRGYGYDNCGAEIYGVWSLIKEKDPRAAGGISLSEIAVLARTNAIADKFRDALRGLGLPVSGSRKNRMPDDWQLALSALSLLVDPANDFHAESVLREGGVDESIILELKTEVAKSEPRMWLSSAALLPNTRPATLTDTLVVLNAMVSDESYQIIRRRVIDLPDGAGAPDLLLDLWRHGWDETIVEEGVTVTTVHNAKGREWDCVFVVGMEEGVFPSNQSLKVEGENMLTGIDTKEPGIEEERRLCFVAMTRARHKLYLTWAKKRTAFFRTTTQKMSRFIDEANVTPLTDHFDTTGGYEIPEMERL